MKTIRALSLHQPWASLIAWELKHFETRSWRTPYRGLLAIHAAKHCDLEDEELLLSDLRSHTGNPDLPAAKDLPRGAVVAVGRLVACHRMTPDLIGRQSKIENMVGWWEQGRYAWEIGQVRALESPIQARGYQGLWKWQAPDELRSIIDQMEAGGDG